MIVNHVVRLDERPDGGKEGINDGVQFAALKGRHDVNADAFIVFSVTASVFLIIFFTGYVMSIPVIGLHFMTFFRHSDRKGLHDDLHAALSRRNALMSDHGDSERRRIFSGRLHPPFSGLFSVHPGRGTVPPLLSGKRRSFPARMVKKGKIRIQISGQHALWILYDAEYPLQTQFLHPQRGALHCSRHKIKSGADADHQALHPVFVLIHPDFLFGRTERNPDKIRFCRIDAFHGFPVFFLCHLPERRRIHPRNFQAGISLYKRFL